jgi:DNA-directed RNA polymerase subunit alpha
MSESQAITPLKPVFKVTEVEATASRATIVIEPLEQGYGHTLGNALRRVMLTSLPGYAITKVRVKGAEHQYSTLEGVSEDILELILSLKQVRIKSEVKEEFTMKLEVSGAGDVTAAQITPGAVAEIVNPELHLATLAKGASLDIEMTVKPGMGYEVATDQTSNVIGEIPVDAMYSPVVRVSYKVEATRVGRRTDFDRIVFEINTDGTVRPIDALNQAARILAKQFTQVFNPVIIEEEVEEETLSPEEAENLRLTVEELDLPTRIANALRKGGFKTVGDLQGAPRAVIAKVKNLGEKSVDVINEALQKKGVSLGE